VVMADSFLEGHKALLMVLFYGLHPIFTNYPWPHYGHSPHMPTVTFGYLTESDRTYLYAFMTSRLGVI
jgi:hypothetical protein